MSKKPERSGWRSATALLMSDECLSQLSATKPLSRAVLWYRPRGRTGRPTGTVPERQEFFTRIVASYLEDVQREEAAQQKTKKRVSQYAASLLLANHISTLPLSDAIRHSIGIYRLEPDRLAARLREYVRYDRQHPAT